jgi:hypothetical protein
MDFTESESDRPHAQRVSGIARWNLHGKLTERVALQLSDASLRISSSSGMPDLYIRPANRRTGRRRYDASDDSTALPSLCVVPRRVNHAYEDPGESPAD